MRGAGIWLVVLLVSCGGAGRERHIQLLDSLKTQVSRLHDSLPLLKKDSAQLAAIALETKQKLVLFPKVYQPDTVDVDVLLMMKNYQVFNLAAARYNIRYQRIRAEVPYTLKQLESLLTDLHNKALKRADAEKYVRVEKESAVKLLNAYRDLRSETKATLRKYDSVSRPVHALIDSLQHDPRNQEAIRLKMLKQKTKRRK